ncbi:MAG: bifunctional folylpolyglutamate synthase/dihydrofolate synthase [Acidimicrobiales bacterium]
MNYAAALEFLDRHVNLEARAGKWEGLSLERMRDLAQVLGDPHEAFPAVHITGTNGKGSTARMVSRLVMAHGLSVGTYTSPHLERYNERIQRNLEPVSDEEFAALIHDIALVEALVDQPPSHFEVLTAAAFRHFADTAVDVGVVEVGVMGRWDATNIVHGQVAVITNIGRDHTDFSGDWRRAIASEKAGIIKTGATLVLGESNPALREVFLAEGQERTLVRGEHFRLLANRLAVGGRLLSIETPRGRVEELFVPLHGAHQGENAALAVVAAEEFFDRPLDPEVAAEAFAELTVPGRFEVMERQPLVILDGAHNPDGAEAAAAVLAEEFAQVAGRRIFVIGMLTGRDPETMLRAFGVRSDDRLITTTPPSPRALPAEELADTARRLGLQAEAVHEVPDALDRARYTSRTDDLILVTGSLYVVGAARAALAGDG